MRALVTDLDGTLRDHATGVPAANWAALRELGRRGICRVVATGRSLYHAERVLEPDAPLDWLIFASGAGWKRWPDGPCVTRAGLAPERVARLADWLDSLELSYSLHAPLPDSHLFHYREGLREGTDFRHRLERNRAFAEPLPPGPVQEDLLAQGASQALVFTPAGEDWPIRLTRGAPDLLVLHSTSPLDGRSQWIELQPRHVSKSRAAADLLESLGISAETCCAIGNDHNDADLLEWAGRAVVVGNAPPDLRERFHAVASCAEGGLAEAVTLWLAERP